MKRLLLTGASGFLGNNMMSELIKSYEVETLGRSVSNDVICDLLNQEPSFRKCYDVVLHAAGLAHFIPKTKDEVQSFFNVNFFGTRRLCNALLLKKKLPSMFVYVSSVAVYGLQEGINITEEAPLLGASAYAQSKIQAENFLTDWCRSNNVTLAILRPSLIVGHNPVGNLGDMVRGMRRGLYASVHKGGARRSVVMAQDIARIVPLIAQYGGGVFNICDTVAPSFRELERVIAHQLHLPMPISIPDWLAKWVLSPQRFEKMSQSLTFSNQKAREQLHWEPLPVLENFII